VFGVSPFRFILDPKKIHTTAGKKDLTTSCVMVIFGFEHIPIIFFLPIDIKKVVSCLSGNLANKVI